MSKYQIYIQYNDGTNAYLQHNDKMAWCKKTANKYYDEVIAKIQNGEWQNIKWVDLQFAYNQ